MTGVIEARKLGKIYRGGRGVFDLDFDVVEGEIFGFLGPNGAGKTTTIRVLMGLLKPTGGSLRAFGMDCWSDSPAIKARVGFVPGELHLYDKMTGSQLIDFFAGFRPAPALENARRLAARFDLDLRQRIQHLSKGNRQKLVLIQALMHDPALLVLDEPTSGLDPLMQVAVLDTLREERGRGKTVFLSSHALAEVEKVADRVAVIREGRLVTVKDVAGLMALRERRMELRFGAPVVAETFGHMPGVRVLESSDSGRHWDLAVRGDLKVLLQRVTGLPLLDLVYPSADLESVFLHYYEGPDEKEAVPA
jgi:ABC-2 type transport system ATP-binding protein